MKNYITLILLFLFSTVILKAQRTSPLIIDHLCTDIYQVPVEHIQKAKTDLHIAYGHTSHGSQITDGMSGLVEFMNNKEYITDLFAWNHDGSNEALHLFEGDGYGEGPMDHDAGYYPNWVDETDEFLKDTANNKFNVIMWSWCGQLSGYSGEDVRNNYLTPMAAFERQYPAITFVYMTGHSDGSGLEGTLHQNNQIIRQFCIDSNKILFDFYDIECYDPDSNYFGDKHVNDACNYDGGGNWAVEWQESHTEGEDWYECGSAHSEPLNANQKAYAAWWMFAKIAGWQQQEEKEEEEEKEHTDAINTSKIYSLKVFQNQIMLQQRFSSVNIFDIQGRLIKSFNTCGKESITINSFQPGLYLISGITNEGEAYNIKYFIQ